MLVKVLITVTTVESGQVSSKMISADVEDEFSKRKSLKTADTREGPAVRTLPYPETFEGASLPIAFSTETEHTTGSQRKVTSNGKLLNLFFFLFFFFLKKHGRPTCSFQRRGIALVIKTQRCNASMTSFSSY